MQFLVNYPLGRKLQRHLEFFITQLEYEHESGRESALEMLAKIFADFPQVRLMLLHIYKWCKLHGSKIFKLYPYYIFESAC